MFSIGSNFVKCSIVCVLFLIIQQTAAKPTSIQKKHSCECSVKMVNYLKDFDFMENEATTEDLKSETIAEMQRSIDGIDENGELDAKTCKFLSGRWQNKIVHWRHKRTEFFDNNVTIRPNEVREILKKAADKWSNITGLTLIECDSKDAEIQFSFTTNQVCNDQSKGERSLKDSKTPIGCAHLPGYVNGGHVQFYGMHWQKDERKTKSVVPYNNFLPAAIHAFGYALGLNESTYKESSQVPKEDQDRMIQQKLYNCNKTQCNVENRNRVTIIAT